MDKNIGLKSVSEILGMNFYIPNYQRGYRWTERQIKDLLDDIYEFSNKKKSEYEFYCMQPLVVKIMSFEEKEIARLNADETWYEVIDGQQRLTTINLLLSFLQQTADALGLSTDTYNLCYQRKTSTFDAATFLVNISTVTQVDDSHIDYRYMSNAYLTIKQWFADKMRIGIKGVKSDICRSLLEYKPDQMTPTRDKANNVRFIWYESKNEDPIKVFTRLNIGKISLTNAELIKALFLNRSNFEEVKDENNIKLRQQEIASEWDNIEYTLQNDEFWLFLHENDNDRYARIDFLFELIEQFDLLKLFRKEDDPTTIDEDKKKDTVGDDRFRTFRYYYEYFRDGESIEKIDEVWKHGIKKYFSILEEWYNDLKSYHYIGYLIEYGHDIPSLINLWDNSHTKDDFIKRLKVKIKEITDKCPKEYKEDGSDKQKAKPALLFHNIQTVINQNTIGKEEKSIYGSRVFYKFPFHLYKKESWDVEHIDSNCTNDLSDSASQKEWLINVYHAVNIDTQKKIVKFFNNSATAEEDRTSLFDEIKTSLGPAYIPEEKGAEKKNRINNYCLLDSSTNRSYGNAIFSAKRRIIIGKDQGKYLGIPQLSKDGRLEVPEATSAKSSFVPPCTKHIFMKYYSSVMSYANYWIDKDAEGYETDIDNCLAQLEN